MMNEGLRVMVLVGSGITAGVLFAVGSASYRRCATWRPTGTSRRTSCSVATGTRPCRSSCRSTAVDGALAVLAPQLVTRLLFGLGAVLLFRLVDGVASAQRPVEPAGQEARPCRPAARRLVRPAPRVAPVHLVRTTLAALAFLANAAAAVSY